MKQYRELIPGRDVLQRGDQFSNAGRGIQSDAGWFAFNDDANHVFVIGNIYRRPIKQDNWISFSDRKPTKGDANEYGRIVAQYEDGTHHFVYFDGDNHFSYWMPLNFVPREPTRVKVDGHEVVPWKDGSLSVGCQTISSQDFEEITRQRNEAMK